MTWNPKYRNFASEELMSDAADEISLSLRLAARDILWLRKLSLDYEGEYSPAYLAVMDMG